VVQLSEKPEKPQFQQQPRSILLDPAILKAAKRIYRTYCVLNAKANKRPSGVAVNEENHRGQLIFRQKPILLPGERFITLKQLETEVSLEY
jgi:hypothetical protein